MNPRSYPYPLRYLILLTGIAITLLGLNRVIPTHWLDWWLSRDQQAMLAFQQGDYQTAAHLFNNPQWRAYALYINQDFAAAERAFSAFYQPEDYLRRANAAAHQRHYQSAIDLYQMALALRPDYPEAAANLALVSALVSDGSPAQEDEVNARIDPQNERSRDTATPEPAQPTTPQIWLGDAQAQAKWLEGLSNRPADFLKVKFRQQWQQQKQNASPHPPQAEIKP